MSGRHWTPYQINIVIWHHSVRSPFPNWKAPAYGPEVDNLVHQGVLQVNDGVLEPPTISTTPLGDVLVQMWLNTPLPRQVYLDPRDGKEVLVEGDDADPDGAVDFEPGQLDVIQGWIRWGGGDCPVPGRARVEVRFRGGAIGADLAASFRWQHLGSDGDVVGYVLLDVPEALLKPDGWIDWRAAASARWIPAPPSRCAGAPATARQRTSPTVWIGAGALAVASPPTSLLTGWRHER